MPEFCHCEQPSLLRAEHNTLKPAQASIAKELRPDLLHEVHWSRSRGSCASTVIHPVRAREPQPTSSRCRCERPLLSEYLSGDRRSSTG